MPEITSIQPLGRVPHSRPVTASFVEALRSGSWLTCARLRIYPAMLGGFVILAVIGLVVTGHGRTDHWNRPLGIDFSGVWVAGQEVRAGHPRQPYDNAAHAAAQSAAFGPSDSFLPWPYPPYALCVAALLAGLPYLAALALWQGGTLLLYGGAVLRAIRGTSLDRRDVLVAALAFPGAAVNLLHGQNGFLSAGLLALGAFCLSQRPLMAGLILGLLAYKPQFALAIPVALMAGNYWRALAMMLATVLLMTLVTWLLFGPAPWAAFAASLSFSRHVILESGGLESYKLQSAFAAVRRLGGPLALAYATQGLATFAVLATLGWLWRSGCDFRLKASALILATLMSTPYVVDYDLVMLGPALAALVAFGVERGFAPYTRSLLAFAWIMPLGAREISLVFGVPIALIVMAALYLSIVRCAVGELAEGRPFPPIPIRSRI